MPSPDITDLDIYIDDLHHNTEPANATPISIPVPTYNDDETRHLYSLKIPTSLWRTLKQRVGKGHIAEFIRQAIYEKLARKSTQQTKAADL